MNIQLFNRTVVGFPESVFGEGRVFMLVHPFATKEIRA